MASRVEGNDDGIPISTGVILPPSVSIRPVNWPLDVFGSWKVSWATRSEHTDGPY
jgi:hypothetical protein